MADSWSGSPATWTTGEAVTAAKMNTEIRDRMDALKAGLVGDQSVDADIKQSIKTGTLAARPAASQAGRLYTATDISNAQFEDNSTGWEHRSGPGVYDGFERANLGSEPSIGTADSGHVWTEPTGDIDIVTSTQLRATTLAGGLAIAQVDTGGIIRSGYYEMPFLTGATPANINVGIILRRAGTGDYIFVQQFGTTGLIINRVVGGVPGTPTTTTFAPAATTAYVLSAWLIGSFVRAVITAPSSTAQVVNVAQSKTLVQDIAPTGTSCGLFLGTTTADCDVLGFAARFN